MNKFSLLFVAVSLMLLVGCESITDLIDDTENEEQESTWGGGVVTLVESTLPSEALFDANEGSFEITFEATFDWSVEYSSCSSWVNLSERSGSEGEYTLTVSYEGISELNYSRTAVLEIYCVTYVDDEATNSGEDTLVLTFTQESGSIIVWAHDDYTDQPYSLLFTAMAYETVFDVMTSASWTVESSADWVTFNNDTEGEEGYGYVIASIATNDEGVDRSAELTFSCSEEEVVYTITQSSAPMTVLESEYTLGHLEGSQIRIPFSAPSEFYLSKSSDEPYFDIVVDYSGDDAPAVVVTTLTENESPRSQGSSFTLGCESFSQTITLVQSGRGVVLVDPDSDTLTIAYNDTSTHSIAYDQDSGAEFPIVLQEGAEEWLSVTSSYSAPYKYLKINALSSNTLGEDRVATVTITGGVEDIVITVTQSCEGVTWDEAQSSASFPFTTATELISFTSNYDWSISLQSDEEGWISIDATSGTAGSYSLGYTIEENQGESVRSAKLVFVANGEEYIFTIEQSPLTLSDLDAGRIPEFDVWNITDSSVSTTSAATTIRSAFSDIEGKGRSITLRFPTATTLPTGLTTTMNYTTLSSRTTFNGGASSEDYIYNTSIVALEAPNVTAVTSTALVGCAALARIDLPKVTSIGEAAFYGSAITLLDLPTATTIKSDAFAGCKYLESVALDAVTSISGDAFSSCISLSSADLPLVTSLSSTFVGCVSLTDISAPLVESISGTFSGCTSLQSVVFDKATYLMGAFDGCTALEEVSLSSLTTLGGSSFSGCTSLKGVDIGAVTKISTSEFYGCSALETIDLSNVTSVEYIAFQGCSSLLGVDLSACETIGSYAFSGCEKLTAISANKLLTVGQYAFSYCTSLQSFEAKALETMGAWAFHYTENVSNVEIPVVQTLGSGALTYCKITSLILPELVSVSNNSMPTTLEYGEFEKLTSISGAFSSTGHLKTLIAPAVTEIDEYEFQGITTLERVVMHGVAKIGYYGFQGCSSLEYADFPRVEYISANGFGSCTSLATCILALECELSVGEYMHYSSTIPSTLTVLPIFNGIDTTQMDLYIGDQVSGSTDFDNNIFDATLMGGQSIYMMQSVNEGAPLGYVL